MINQIKPLLILVPLILLGLLNSCNEEKKIFWISETKGQVNDFIFMAESTNVPTIDSIGYLTMEELVSAELLTFKKFGTIHENETFKVIVLLKEGTDTGRDYTFIIRTFDKAFNIIDSYELANWIDSENRYCFGSINEDLIIKRKCKYEEGEDVHQILMDGRIVATSNSEVGEN